MSKTKWIVAFVLADWIAYTGWVAMNGGSLSDINAMLSINPWGTQIALDLVLALALVSVWIWKDAREHGRSAVPWIVATACLGSIGPLAYLLYRPEDPVAAATR